MLRNVGGQAIGSQVLNRNTGEAFAGAVTVYVTGDGGTQAPGAIGAGACVAEGNGYYSYTPSQAETNFAHVAFTFIGDLAIPVTVTVATVTEAQHAALAGTPTITTFIGDGPTRIELLNQLAHRLNKTPPPNMDSSTETRLASFLNQRQRRLLTMPGLKRLREATITFTSVPEAVYVSLPHVAKVNHIFERTNDRTLYEMSMTDYRLIDPNPISGTPEAYIWHGHQAVAWQPRSPTSLMLQSVAGTDTTQRVYIEGITSGNYTEKATVQLQGTTPVLVPPSNWSRIDKFYLSAPTAGHVGLKADDDLVLGIIAAGTTTTVYTGIRLWPTPSAAILYYADITRVVSDLTQPTDQTPLPNDFADLLVLGSLADEYQHLSDPRWSAAMTEYKERENQLKYWLAESAVGRPFQLTRGWQKGSQLGSWFPAGS